MSLFYKAIQRRKGGTKQTDKVQASFPFKNDNFKHQIICLA